MKKKQINPRIPARDFERLQQKADELGTSVTDVACKILQNSVEQIELAELLTVMERRLVNCVFNICCAIADLDSLERQEAKDKFTKLNRGSR